jgi:hypothetical protein
MTAMRAAISAELQHERAAMRSALKDEIAPLKEEIASFKGAQGLTSPTPAIRGEQLWRNCPASDKLNATAGFPAAYLDTAASSPCVAKFLRECVGASSADRAAAAKTRSILDADAVAALAKQFPPGYDYLEKELIAFLTPYLADVVEASSDAQQLLVNSEHLEWIRTEGAISASWRKPDLFVCHASAFVAGKEPGGKSERTLEAARIREAQRAKFGTTYRFGRCEWKLRDAAECTFEGKRRTMSLHEALGECHAKAQYLLADHPALRGIGSTVHSARKCVLFDEAEVHLLRFSSQGLLSSVLFGWQTPGSFLALLAFLDAPVQPRWLRVLQSVSPSLSANWTLDWPNAFLGAGGMGKVFRLRRVETAAASSASSDSDSSCVKVAALKIVDDAHSGLHVTALQREAEQVLSLTTPSRDLPSDVVAVLPRVLHPFTLAREPGTPEAASAATIGAAVVFVPVGESLADATRNMQLWLEVCDAMLTLHLAAIVHGDPRIPNLIRVAVDTPRAGAAATRAGSTVQLTSNLVWIDFCAMGQAGIAADCRICLESFFNCHRQFASDQPRVIRIGQYADDYQQLVQPLLHPVSRDTQGSLATEAMSDWRQTVWNDIVVNLERS